MSFRSFLMALFLAATVVVSGCGNTGTPGGVEAPPEDALLVGNSEEPETLDPHLSESVYASRILTALFEGLVTLDQKTLEPMPGVAESWEVSEDGLTYTFHLRDDAKWSNGAPMTAHDFTYSWQRMLTPELASPYSYMLYCLKNARAFNEGEIDDFSRVGAKAVDDHTLRVDLEYPAPYFLTLHSHASWYPVHKETVEQFGEMAERNTKWVRQGNHVGNGPYRLARWEPESVIEVTQNPYYWNNENTRIETVRFLPIGSENTEERMFRSGELHMTERVPLAKIDTWRENDPELLRIDDYAAISYAFANVEKAPFNDRRVRRAFSLSLNREAIAEQVRQGVDKPAYHFTPAGIGAYYPPTEIEEDIEEARRLLAEAGYPGGEGFPDVQLLYSTSDAGKYLTEAMQQMWQKNLGVKVQINNQEWKVFLSTINIGDYDIGLMGWVGDFLDPVTFLELFTTDNGNNRTGFSNARYDDLIQKARFTNHREERNRLFGEAETLLLEESPVMPVYFRSRAFLCRPEVKNFPGNLIDYRRFDRMYFGAAAE